MAIDPRGPRHPERLAGDDAPLLRPRWARSLVCLALAATGILVVAAVLMLVVVWYDRPWLLGAAVALVVLGPVAIRPMEVGRWSASPWRRWPERVAVALLVAIGLGFAARGTWLGVEGLAERDALGTPSLDIAWWFAEATAALAGVVLILASVPLGIPRRVAWRTLGAGAAAVAACGVAASAVYAGPDGCAGFRLDPDRWRAALHAGRDDDEAELMAESIVRCQALDGRTRAEARRLLGPAEPPDPDVGSGSVRWQVGWVGDAIGPGDEQGLTLWFDDGRVSSAELWRGEYPAD